jgi:type VI secretion system protein ImpC
MSEEEKIKKVEVNEELESININELDSLLEKSFRSKNEEKTTEISDAVKSLAKLALQDTKLISKNVATTIEGLVGAIDEKMTAQVNEIIHNENFMKLEGRWRGLKRLVYNTETCESLKIRVYNADKDELGKLFKKYQGTAFDQSPLFKRFYEDEYGTAGGEPISCVIGDYDFSHRAPDIAWIQGMQQVVAAIHAPFITSANSELFNMETWQELANPRDLEKLFSSPEYASWRSLREMEDSKYIVFTMPRTLARIPYDPMNNPVEEFHFIESVINDPDKGFVWSSAAYAMALNINHAFTEFGWCSCIRGVENGGVVNGLPVYAFKTDDGGMDMRCPTEIAITDRREAELSQSGLLPLLHWKNTDYAVFIGAQSLYKPGEYEDPDATANANLSARLPYLFAVCRFAHYLKCIVRDKIGSFHTKESITEYLTTWILKYVVQSNCSSYMKARFPLSAAEVVVEEDTSNPGYYKAIFYLKPHYQLEGLTVSLRLVSKLPSEK